MKTLELSRWITMDRSVARSVNLERDEKDRGLLERFQATPVACETLRRLADALAGESVNAWSLTGPYGAGKSAFCNFMLALTCGERETRTLCYEKLLNADNETAARLKEFVLLEDSQAPGVGIRAVSHYESLNNTLARSLIDAVEKMPNQEPSNDWKKARERVNDLSNQEWPSTNAIADSFKALVKAARRPIFLVVDELGKNLEFQAHHAERGDIFALQTLAELKSVFIFVCLHQAFSVYSSALSRTQREEWQKIQGRFEDRAYIEPPTRSFALIQGALSFRPPATFSGQALEDWAGAMKKTLSSIRIDGLPKMDEAAIASRYPFHPLSVYLLGEMSRRFAQNDRTIFAFLASGEKHAFSACLQRLDVGDHRRLPTLGLDMLYDYFCEAGALRHTDRAENQRWIEIHAIITSHNGMDPVRIKLLKTIGVLNLLSSLPGISASKEIIHAALATSFYRNKVGISALLKELTNERVLLFRKYAKEYRLWEGSDFDLDREVLEARGRVALRSVAEMLEEVSARPHLVAARHTIQTGTFREFAEHWCSEDDVQSINTLSRAENDGDGTIWLMLGRRKEPEGIGLMKKVEPVIVGYSPRLDQVRQLMIEAVATRDACAAPQLERDGVARREARYRAALAEQALDSFLEEAFSPVAGATEWFVQGERKSIRSYRELSMLASDVCDRIYHQSPRINNEMINVERLSSMAAAARNRVAEAMANQSMVENLGLTGFGPEVAVYRTVFKESALHRKNADEAWELAAPDKELQPKLAAAWEVFDSVLAKSDEEGRAVPVKSLLDTLKRQPFGLRQGPMPLLLAHYLLVRADEVAVYEDNVFQPFVGDAEITLLMRRPELFSLRSYQPSGVRSEVIRTYYGGGRGSLDSLP